MTFHPLFSPNMDKLLNYLEYHNNLASNDPLFGKEMDNLLDYLQNYEKNNARSKTKKISRLEEELYLNVEKCLNCYTLGKKNIIAVIKL